MNPNRRLELKLYASAAASARPLQGFWRLLGRLGPSWRSAPIRRLTQLVCLLLYLVLFFYVAWPYAEVFSSGVFPDKEWLPAELWLWLDPLVGLSTAIAARCWNVALFGVLAILVLGLFFPRGFCGYLCPLGTTIDFFDYVIARRLRKFHVRGAAGLGNLRFYVLGAVLAAALFGVMLSGFFSAIPVFTRGLLLTAGSLQLGLVKNWGMVPGWTGASLFSLGLFLAIFGLGLLGPRFWCRYLCPSGALMSLAGLWKIFHREVDSSCTQCGRCREVCSFDAINLDFTTRNLHCTSCQTCAGACPQEAIHFVAGAPTQDVPDTLTAKPMSRRTMLGASLCGAATALGTRMTGKAAEKPIRPPGSVSEARFLDLCIRCGECIKVCPGPVLQLAGLNYGLESLWTPVACFSHAGCHQDCNFCTLVCPTQAIRPLPLPAKRQERIGLAIIEPSLCLPHRGERDCQLCFDECNAAGYRAIEMRPIKLETGQMPEGAFSASELEEMGRINAPFVRADQCVGCGLCEYRCTAANVRQQRLIPKTAIIVRPVAAV